MNTFRDTGFDVLALAEHRGGWGGGRAVVKV